MKKVSVIVPVYNVGEYLKKCLDSILQQNFDDYEIICVDDASTDHSRDILEQYERQYDNIRVIRHVENRGVSAARNTGLKYASGKYVWFVDSDDMIMPGSLAELYYTAEKENVDIIRFKLRSANNRNHEKIDNIHGENEKVYTGKELLCILAYDKKRHDSACIIFIRRDFLAENQIAFYEGILHEDVLFSFLCIVQAGRIINTDKEYYNYICNKRPTSITAQKTHRSAESNFVIMMQLILYWHTHSFTETENAAMKAYVFSRYSAYQYYDRFGIRAQKLEAGSPVDKALYDIFYNMIPDRLVRLNKDQLEHIINIKNVIVFGAAHYAGDIIDILQENRIEIRVVAVSSTAFNPSVFCGIPVDTIEHISEYLKEDTVIVLGVSLENSMAVRRQLETLGYMDIIVPEYKE